MTHGGSVAEKEGSRQAKWRFLGGTRKRKGQGKSGTDKSHSVLNACMGSSRDALHAGRMQAAADTPSSTRLTRRKTPGSSAFVWYNIDCSSRVTSALAPRPRISPYRAGRSPS